METIAELLNRHSGLRPPWYRRWSVIGSVMLHVGIAVAAVLAPTLLAKNAPVPEFVSIQIVPSAALGQLTPPPPPARPVTPPPAAHANPTRSPSRSRRPSQKQPEPARVVRRESQPAAQLPTEELEPAPVERRPTPRQGSPRGSALATGAGSEISAFDDPDFTYGYYADLMLSRIRAKWERPPLGGKVEMVVYFRIRTDGSVDGVKILRSSGYNSFDRAGLQAVQRAAMPPLPRSYRSPSLGVRLIIR